VSLDPDRLSPSERRDYESGAWLGDLTGLMSPTGKTHALDVSRLTKEIDQGEAAIEAAKWERAERLAGLAAEGYTRRDIAADTGMSATTVGTAIRIWEAYGVRARAQRPRYTDADYEIVGRGPGFGNSEPAIVAGASKMQHENKVEIARKLFADPEVVHEVLSQPKVRRAVVDEMTNRGEAAVAREIEKLREPNASEEWHSWLNRLNSLLVDGARLTDRPGRLDAHAQAARLFYDRITERRLDGEIREFFEKEGAIG
jgi:hypothetical protein